MRLPASSEPADCLGKEVDFETSYGLDPCLDGKGGGNSIEESHAGPPGLIWIHKLGDTSGLLLVIAGG